MSQRGGKSRAKTHHVNPPSAAEQILTSMSSSIVSNEVDMVGTVSPSGDGSDVEGSGVPPSRRMRAPKKKNYTDDEMEILVDEVIANYKILFPGKNDNCPMVVRNAGWSNIMVKVNSIGIAPRTIPELKKKWSDLKKKVKAKMAVISRYARQTGGGPSCPETLNAIEAKVGSTCRREQIEGFGTVDVCMQAITSNSQGQIRTEDTESQFPPEDLVAPSPQQARSPVEHDSNITEPDPVIVTPASGDILLPADLGLTENQSAYLNDYTKQHLSFMSRVDGRLDGVEKGLLKLADAYVSAANIVSLGLSKIANILEKQTQKNQPTVDLISPSRDLPMTNTPPEGVGSYVTQVSPSSLITGNSVTSINSLNSNEGYSVTSVDGNTLHYVDSIGQPLDLSRPDFVGKPTDKAIFSKLEHPNVQSTSTATFLMSCKQELCDQNVLQRSAPTVVKPLAKYPHFPTGHESVKKKKKKTKAKMHE